MTPMTVVGGSGFIGSHVAGRLEALGIEHDVPGRGDDLTARDLGCLVYCVGITSDFRERTFDTVDAHVSHLAHILRTAVVERLIFLSSTRVYRRSDSPAGEDAPLYLDPSQPEDLYELSKAMGEAIAFAAPCPAYVLRLSNVYGDETASSNFLTSIVRAAVVDGGVVVRTAPDSEKDYVSVTDVVDMVVNIAERGRQHTYNVASGTNVTHLELLRRLEELTGCDVRWQPDAPRVAQPEISIARLKAEFGFRPSSVLEDLETVVAAHRRAVSSPTAMRGRP